MKEKKHNTDKLLAIPMNLIGPNPHRDLSRYPPEPERVAAIRESIADVGWFPGSLVVRMTSARDFPYQQAFGHRRLQAARDHFRNPGHKLIVVVRNLSDEDMLKYMVRENIAENTGRDFLMLLETWEATQRFLSSHGYPASTHEVASFMGWDRPTKSNGRMLLTNSAYGCNAAHELLDRGLLMREDFAGLALGQAIKLAREAHGKLRTIESKSRGLPESEVNHEMTRLHDNTKAAAVRLREANESKMAGAEATRALRSEARGPAPLPDVKRAIERSRLIVQSWDLSERVNAFCNVAEDLDKYAHEQLEWLIKDLTSAIQRLTNTRSQIDEALKKSPDVFFDTVGAEVKLISTGDGR